MPIDAWYGALAGLILIVGFSRAIFAAKGWAYYAHNAFFWAKIGTFIAIALLSVPPTLAFLKWRRTGASPTLKETFPVFSSNTSFWMTRPVALLTRTVSGEGVISTSSAPTRGRPRPSR